MKNNTYEIKGTYFWLLQFRKDEIVASEQPTEELFRLIKAGKYNETDYKGFSGKTIDDISRYEEYSALGYIVIVGAVQLPYNNNNGFTHYHSRVSEVYYVKMEAFAKECLLDDALGSIMINNFESYSSKSQSMARCFLQRYIFETKEKTDAALKELLGIEPHDNTSGLKKLLQKVPKSTDM